MRPADKNQKTSFIKRTARRPEAMRRRLWHDIAGTLPASRSAGDVRLWRLLMNSRMTQLTVTALVVVLAATLWVGLTRRETATPPPEEITTAQEYSRRDDCRSRDGGL